MKFLLALLFISSTAFGQASQGSLRKTPQGIQASFKDGTSKLLVPSQIQSTGTFGASSGIGLTNTLTTAKSLTVAESGNYLVLAQLTARDGGTAGTSRAVSLVVLKNATTIIYGAGNLSNQDGAASDFGPTLTGFYIGRLVKGDVIALQQAAENPSGLNTQEQNLALIKLGD